MRSNTCSFLLFPLQNWVKFAWTRGPLLSTFWKSMDCLKRIESFPKNSRSTSLPPEWKVKCSTRSEQQPDRIRFVFVLLATDAQRQHVNEPHRRRLLLELAVRTVEVALVVPPDFIDAALELHRLVELVEVALALERRVGREHHVFILGHDLRRATRTRGRVDGVVSRRRHRREATRVRVDGLGGAASP